MLERMKRATHSVLIYRAAHIVASDVANRMVDLTMLVQRTIFDALA